MMNRSGDRGCEDDRTGLAANKLCEHAREVLRAWLDVPTGSIGMEIARMMQRDGFEASRHEVSQRGSDHRGDLERGQVPISTMRPPQIGHRSMRWPVRMA